MSTAHLSSIQDDTGDEELDDKLPAGHHVRDQQLGLAMHGYTDEGGTTNMSSVLTGAEPANNTNIRSNNNGNTNGSDNGTSYMIFNSTDKASMDPTNWNALLTQRQQMKHGNESPRPNMSPDVNRMSEMNSSSPTAPVSMNNALGDSVSADAECGMHFLPPVSTLDFGQRLPSLESISSSLPIDNRVSLSCSTPNRAAFSWQPFGGGGSESEVSPIMSSSTSHPNAPPNSAHLFPLLPNLTGHYSSTTINNATSEGHPASAGQSEGHQQVLPPHLRHHQHPLAFTQRLPNTADLYPSAFSANDIAQQSGSIGGYAAAMSSNTTTDQGQLLTSSSNLTPIPIEMFLPPPPLAATAIVGNQPPASQQLQQQHHHPHQQQRGGGGFRRSSTGSHNNNGGNGGNRSGYATPNSSLSDDMTPTMHSGGGGGKQHVKQRSKKESHNRIERKRRDYINSQIVYLSTLLPPELYRDVDGRRNKGSVLRLSVNYIVELRDAVSQMTGMKQEITLANQLIPNLLDRVEILEKIMCDHQGTSPDELRESINRALGTLPGNHASNETLESLYYTWAKMSEANNRRALESSNTVLQHMNGQSSTSSCQQQPQPGQTAKSGMIDPDMVQHQQQQSQLDTHHHQQQLLMAAATQQQLLAPNSATSSSSTASSSSNMDHHHHHQHPHHPRGLVNPPACSQPPPPQLISVKREPLDDDHQQHRMINPIAANSPLPITTGPLPSLEDVHRFELHNDSLNEQYRELLAASNGGQSRVYQPQ